MEDGSDTFAKTPRTDVRRKPARASYDRELVHAILDEGLVAHVGFVVDAQPYVIPMASARVDDVLYLHGAPASRLLRALAEGVPACATVTLVDAIVFARSAMHHSLNYRSVVVLGRATLVEDAAEKRRALEALVEHVAKGRGAEARPPDEKELASTRVLALPLVEVSAKVRTGPPVDDADDLSLPVWAGELPLRIVAGEAIADPGLDAGIAVSPSVAAWSRMRKR